MIEINSKVKSLVEGNALAVATTDKDGNPHYIAVGYPKIVSENLVVISVYKF